MMEKIHIDRYSGDSVELNFCHGNPLERIGELERIGSLLGSGLKLERRETS